ncbi:MAG: acyl dehydratase, partial [Deltaproteobacteria bacterium]|nr:acyl dehydratase [Deltaproteobacteria bacterium]
MSDMRQRAIAGLKLGDSFVFSRTFSQAETESFGDLTRDYNPVHYDRRFAQVKGYPDLICHGLLVGGLICEMGGQVAWLATSMNFNFLKPNYFGDTVTCTVTITSLDHRSRAEAKADFVNQDGVKVLEASMTGYLPGAPEKKVLAQM